jgi:large subunit ribosomal protein L16
MLMPSRTKYRKVRKGKIHGGKATALSTIAYGKYALVSNSSERITARQIEGIAKVKAGTIMFEMDGVAESVAREAMRLAAHKLPVKTTFIIKEEA